MIYGEEFMRIFFKEDVPSLAVCVIAKHIKEDNGFEQLPVILSEVEVVIFEIIFNELLEGTCPVGTVVAEDRSFDRACGIGATSLAFRAPAAERHELAARRSSVVRRSLRLGWSLHAGVRALEPDLARRLGATAVANWITAARDFQSKSQVHGLFLKLLVSWVAYAPPRCRCFPFSSL